MQRAAHEPGLDQAPVFPERRPDVGHRASAADRKLKLRGGHDLRLGPADIGGHSGQVLLSRRHQVVALHPEGMHLGPGELGLGG